MTTESKMSHYSRITGALLLATSSMLFSSKAPAQAAVPQVTASVSTGLTHPTTPAWGNLTATGVTTNGDFLVQDFSYGTLYEFPADGSPMITLLAQGSLGGYQDPGFAIDSNNTLYIEGNWSNCVLRFPYDPTTKTWPNLGDINTAVNPNNSAQGCPSQDVIIGNTYPYQYWPADLNARYVQPKGMVTDSNNNLIIGTYDAGDSWIGVFPMTTTNGTTSAGPIQVLLQHASGYTMSVAVDKWGNTYFTENQGANGDFPHPLPGVLMIPAGTSDLQTDTGLVRIDPNLPDVTGVTSDPQGNLYVSDGVKGIVMVPAATAAGSLPQTANSVFISPNAAQGNVSIDWPRQTLFVPTSTKQTNGQADVAKVRLGKADLGSIAVATTTTAIPVTFAFNGAVTPGSFAIEEDGGTADFAVATGGTCVAGTAYALQNACTVNVAATPNSAGSVSAKLVALDGSSNVLASASLHSVGLGSAITASPAAESGIGSGLKTPSQVAVDASGNTYVADAGLGKVLMYAKGATTATAGTSIGTGLMMPTGVAADGAGDVFIADSGTIFEVPFAASGLNASAQTTVRSGLGSNVKLAADGVGNLYVTDPDNARVIKLGQAGATAGGMLSPEIDFTGFTAPAAVAVDAGNNVYVLDNQNLLELQPDAAPTVLITGLGAASGMAFDPSGSLYVSLPGGTQRIPNVGGVLTQSAQTVVAADVTAPAGIAIDKTGNIYIADSGAENLHQVSDNASLAFGTISSSTSADVSLLNIGNSPLAVTGFTSSDTADFTVAGCTDPVAAGSSCDATVTITLGPGVQGSITSTITVNGNQANTPVAINATASAGALASSGGVTISVPGTANVNNTPVTITVAPASGAATPTGTVTLSVDGGTPTNATLTNGSVTINLAGLSAGSHTFAVTYVGDRTYGSASASVTSVVAKGNVMFSVPAFPSYVLSNGGAFPYNPPFVSYQTTYTVSLTGAAGIPVTGYLNFMQGSNLLCSQQDAANNNYAYTTRPVAGEASFLPGCMPISANQTTPNEITQQTITSIVYTGDANYLPATITSTTAGGPLSFNELRQPSVAISPNSASLTLSNGKGSVQLSLASVLGYGVSTNAAYPTSLKPDAPTENNYTLPVSLTCQGLPAYASCSFSGGNYTDGSGVLHTDEYVINTDPSMSVPIQVTITSNNPTASNSMTHSTLAFAALFGFGLLGLASRHRLKNARLLSLTCMCILAGATLGLTSCSSNTFSQESSTISTPSGTFAVTITAQQIGSIATTDGAGNPITVYGIQNQVSIPYTLNVTVQ